MLKNRHLQPKVAEFQTKIGSATGQKNASIYSWDGSKKFYEENEKGKK